MPAADVKPIYILHGSDGFLLEKHRRDVLAAAVGDADPALAVSAFDGEATTSDVLDALRTVPFLTDRRIIVVRDADAFIGRSRQALEAYAARPCETGVLILVVSSLRSQGKFEKRVAEIGRVIDCTPRKRDLPAQVRSAAKRRGKDIDRQAAAALVEWIGPDLLALGNELDKLASYTGDRERITLDDLTAVVRPKEDAEDFALSNAITAGDIPAALRALDRALTARGEEFRVLGNIGWHLRRLRQAQLSRLAGRGLGLRLPPDVARRLNGLLERRSLHRIEADFRRLLRTDLGMKSGLEARAALQGLVVELCL